MCASRTEEWGAESDVGPRTKTISNRHVHTLVNKKKGERERERRFIRFRRDATLGNARRFDKSGTGCRDTDLTNHKGRIMATYSSIQNHGIEQRRKLVRFVMLINWLTFPSYYCTDESKADYSLVVGPSKSDQGPFNSCVYVCICVLCLRAILLHRTFYLRRSQRSQRMCRRFRQYGFRILIQDWA